MKSRHDFPSLNQKLPEGVRPDGTHITVMVVDDQEFNRKQLQQIFESEGYDVVGTAENGQIAINKLKALNYKVDIITTELDMPVLDGYALLFNLNERENRPMVIFISEDTTKGVMQDLISMGIADYVLKPINRRTLLDRVHRAAVKAGLTTQ